jgi:POT family proton-dependent oligopeptide transporter
VTEAAPSFAENAPASYFSNAGPQTPRPDKRTFDVVSPEQYKKLEADKELSVVEDKPVHVTQEAFDRVYAHASAETPILPPGKHLRVINTELFQSINSGYIIVLTPLIVVFWSFLRRRNAEPSTPAKIGLGLLLTAAGPLIMWAATRHSADGAVKASAAWLFGTYAAVTLGELCLSPMGLSLVNQMAPRQISAFMMGGWFVATSFGNKLSGICGELYTKMDHPRFWLLMLAANVLFGGIIFGILPWLNRQMAADQQAS